MRTTFVACRIWLTALLGALALAGCTPDTPVSNTGPGAAPQKPASSRVEGRVMTPDGQPISGTTVVPVSTDTPKQPIPELAALTDDTGRHAWSLLPGRYERMASADGYQPQTRPVEIKQGQVATLDFTLTRP